MVCTRPWIIEWHMCRHKDIPRCPPKVLRSDKNRRCIWTAIFEARDKVIGNYGVKQSPKLQNMKRISRESGQSCSLSLHLEIISLRADFFTINRKGFDEVESRSLFRVPYRRLSPYADEQGARAIVHTCHLHYADYVFMGSRSPACERHVQT